MAYKGKPANIAKHQAMAKAMTANKKLGTPHGNPLLQDNSGDYNPSPDGIQNGAPDNGPMPFPALGMGIGDGKAN